MSNPATTLEPAPVRTDSPHVWPAIIASLPYQLAETPNHVVHALSEAMQDRHEFGLQKYGTPLQVENGRNHGNDALQEALDGCAYSYAQAAKTNSAAWWVIHHTFLDLAARILYQLRLEEAER